MKLSVVFDLDGTLIDTPSGIVETFFATLESIGHDFQDEAAIRATIGLPLEVAFSGLMGIERNDPLVTQAVKQYQQLFNDIVLPKAKTLIFPGVPEGLAKLKAKGFVLSVATSKFTKNAETLLKAAELWDFFHLVVGIDQVEKPKPHPEMGHLVLNTLGLTAENSLMVGDTTHDLFMARDSGMRSIAVTYGVHDTQKLKDAKPTWMAESFDHVLTCVQQGFSLSDGHFEL